MQRSCRLAVAITVGLLVAASAAPAHVRAKPLATAKQIAQPVKPAPS